MKNNVVILGLVELARRERKNPTVSEESGKEPKKSEKTLKVEEVLREGNFGCSTADVARLMSILLGEEVEWTQPDTLGHKTMPLLSVTSPADSNRAFLNLWHKGGENPFTYGISADKSGFVDVRLVERSDELSSDENMERLFTELVKKSDDWLLIMLSQYAGEKKALEMIEKFRELVAGLEVERDS